MPKPLFHFIKTNDNPQKVSKKLSYEALAPKTLIDIEGKIPRLHVAERLGKVVLILGLIQKDGSLKRKQLSVNTENFNQVLEALIDQAADHYGFTRDQSIETQLVKVKRLYQKEFAELMSESPDKNTMQAYLKEDHKLRYFTLRNRKRKTGGNVISLSFRVPQEDGSKREYSQRIDAKTFSKVYEDQLSNYIDMMGITPVSDKSLLRKIKKSYKDEFLSLTAAT